MKVEIWRATRNLFLLLNTHLQQGFYRGGKFSFSFKVGPGYPHEPPKVKCETQVYHPNIDLEGNVCLNILREDWKPVLTINSIIYGLQYLFLVSYFPQLVEIKFLCIYYK
jgi:ubiquitin-protein ligase